MAPKEVREILVKVDTNGAPGLKQLASQFSQMNKGVRDFNSTLGGLKNAFIAIQGFSLAGVGLGQLVDVMDSMQKLGDRLKLSEGSTEAATLQMKKLGDVANETNSNISDIATIYNRLSLSLRDVGVNSETLLDTTKLLQNTFRISGATAAEATAATIQLTQGMASGQIRGQELRSVLEQNAVVGDILAKQMKTTRGELLKFAEKEGGISAADFMKALANNMESVTEQANVLKPTISEALTKNFNSLKIELAELNKEFGITDKVVKILNFTFENLLIPTLGIVAGIAGFKGLMMVVGGVTSAFSTLAEVGAIVAYIGLPAIGAALLPVIAGVTALVGGIIFLTDRLGNSDGVVRTSANEWIEYGDAVEGVSESSTLSLQALSKQSEEFEKSAKSLFDEIKGGTPLLSLLDVSSLESPMQRSVRLMKESADRLASNKVIAFDYSKSLKFLNNSLLDNTLTQDQYNKKLKELSIENVTDQFKKGQMVASEYFKKLDEIKNGKAIKATKDFERSLAELNKEFNKGEISIENYVSQFNQLEVDKISAQMGEGKKNVLDFNKALRERDLKNLSSELRMGAISIREFKSATEELQLQQLNEDFKANLITLSEYDKKFVETSSHIGNSVSIWRSGIQDYLTTSGTFAQNTARLITDTFVNLEDVFLNFIKKGKFEFAEFTQAILDDLTRIIVRAAIIQPLAQGILGFMGPAPTDKAGGTTSMSTDYLNMKANGGAFNRGVEFYANGGVFNRPTLFKHSDGIGVLGEKGAEAIMPLERGADGKLGVKSSGSNVTVNIINQTGNSEVTQTESTSSDGSKTIDILIQNKVQEVFGKGAMDKTMSQLYGVRRRGA